MLNYLLAHHAPFNRQLVEVTGGQQLTIVSTADSLVMSNVRLEVLDSTKLVLDIPDLTITGVIDSVGKITLFMCCFGSSPAWQGWRVERNWRKNQSMMGYRHFKSFLWWRTVVPCPTQFPDLEVQMVFS